MGREDLSEIALPDSNCWWSRMKNKWSLDVPRQTIRLDEKVTILAKGLIMFQYHPCFHLHSTMPVIHSSEIGKIRL